MTSQISIKQEEFRAPRKMESQSLSWIADTMIIINQISDFRTDNSHWGVRSLLYAKWS